MNIAPFLGFLTLVAVAVLWSGLSSVVVAMYRESLFSLRAALFDYALEGNIAFDDPQYRQTETLLNVEIRTAEHMNHAVVIPVIVANMSNLSAVEPPLRDIRDPFLLRLKEEIAFRTMLFAFIRIPVGILILLVAHWFGRRGNRERMAGETVKLELYETTLAMTAGLAVSAR